MGGAPGGGRFRFGGLGTKKALLAAGANQDAADFMGQRSRFWRRSGWENLAGRECGAAGGPGEGQDRGVADGRGGGFGGIVGNENGFIRALSAGESGALNAGGMVPEAGAEHVSARYVYDGEES